VFRRGWRWPEAVFWLACLGSYFLFPTQHFLLTQIFIIGLLALSLDLIVGFAGIISLGQAAFFGTGAYAAGLLGAHGWTEPLSGLVAAAAVAAILGYASAQLVVRVHGIAALMITLGINELFSQAANRAISVTGGADGLQGVVIAPLLRYFPFDLYGNVAFFYSLIVLFVLFLLARRLVRSPFGLALAGIRQNPQRMLSLGTPVRHHLVLVYTMSAAIAGIAGALMAQTNQFVGLDSISFELSAEVLIILILGGAGWLYGGIVGAAIYLVAHDQLANLNPRYWLFWLGLLLVVVVLLAVGGGFERLRNSVASALSLGSR
ncbi:MAG: branched-chain amino acid ABC transporter permease, partial [Gemmataceae bacterium]